MTVQLRVRTEYSFRRAYGKVDRVLDAVERALEPGDLRVAAITDGGCWGYASWAKACAKRGLAPIFGATLPVVRDAALRERQPAALATLLARSAAGVRELYALVTRANLEGHYYYPRLDYGAIGRLSREVFALMGHGTDLAALRPRPETLLALCPTNRAWNRRAAAAEGWERVVVSDAHYPFAGDAAAYEILAQRDRLTRAIPMHLLTGDELRLAAPEAGEAEFAAARRVAAECSGAELPRAENVRIASDKTLRELCLEGAAARGFELTPERAARLDRELGMIAEKDFEDYFFLLAELIGWAKGRMLVGPARGSSAGSLACYLLGITDVDPLRHGLMFERFIDVTRADLPDVDVDFQDDRRDLVIEHLREKYGADRVGRIGTVSRLKSKSALADAARGLGIPLWEIRSVQDAVIERSIGDSRAQFCVRDALETLEIGKALLAKHPALAVAGELEGHAQHTGKHAAGVIVALEPVVNYCALDVSGVAQVDKKDAEAIGLLKIDALGLRVLSVVQDCLDRIGKDRRWLAEYRLDDEAAFSVLNDERYAGIFQFEGYALQSLTRQMKVESFEDLSVLGALARPGPLHCGVVPQFIARRKGEEPVRYLHPLAEPATSDTYGVVVYQEQVMELGRRLGKLSWEHVSELRKAMSKSLGEEFFNRYWEKFRAGTREHGLSDEEARAIWDQMCTFGSWAFNKSHAVSYGLVSYWCCVLKAHWPLEFAAACLRHEKDSKQGVQILRELVKAGHRYRPVDSERSGLEWSVVDGVLVGGLTCVKGMGLKKAADVLARRAAGKPLLPGQAKLLAAAVTPYDDVFEGERRFGAIYARPERYNVLSGRVSRVAEVAQPGEYVFLAKIAERNLRDMNEYGNLVKRGGRRVEEEPLFLNLTLEDDTGNLMARISRWDYERWGKPIVEAAKVGDWFMWKGIIKFVGIRMLHVKRWRCLEEGSPLYKPFGSAVTAEQTHIAAVNP